MTGRVTSRWAMGGVGVLLAVGSGLGRADTVSPAQFSWRASLALPAGANVARAPLPAQALTRLQSSDARDLRVFNSAGEVVAFALIGPPPAAATPPALTRSYPALALYHPVAGARQPKGSTQVRIDGAGGQRSVWVQLDGTDVAAAPKLSSALFATKDEKQSLGALQLQATLPANTPVRLTASSSADLAQWRPVPVRGRLYRFEGPGAPENMTLEFESPLQLEGRYLRLDWHGQERVTVTGVTGVVASPLKPPRVRAELPAPQAAGPGAVEIATDFLTPLAGLVIAATRENSLLPVRVLGRNDASQPWRHLAQTVVYRLGAADARAVNPPLALYGASVRRLRIESTHGADLAAAGLQVSAEFEPMQVVFLATGAGPFQLAAGRPGTSSAALPVSMIAAALGAKKVEELPQAVIGAAVLQASPDAGALAKLWPGAPGKTTLLWTVLLAGVVLLGGVAWSLLRQLKGSTPPS